MMASAATSNGIVNIKYPSAPAVIVTLAPVAVDTDVTLCGRAKCKSTVTYS